MTDAPQISSDAPPEGASGGSSSLLAQMRSSPAVHGALLALFCLATALLLAIADDLTRDPIAARAAEDLYASLEQVLPASLHDNDPTASLRTINDENGNTVEVYTAEKNGNVTAVAFELTGYGYGGAIHVLMGIDPEGHLLGVRVLSHSETPGLGDKIEVEKSNWVHAFRGHSLGDPAEDGWKVKRDGGVFDQFSGASITPRAVVKTVHRGLQLFENNRTALLASPERQANGSVK